MAGGTTTPALVAAAAQVGGMGFLAAGYKTPGQLGAQLSEVRDATPVVGVNLFAPNPLAVDAAEYRAYAEALRPLADHYKVDLPAEPVEDDDHWHAKLELLRRDPVPVVSFTFGIPDRKDIDALRAQGSVVIQTITTPAEARAATDVGVDMLVVQACAAGAHSATLTPRLFPEPIPTKLWKPGAIYVTTAILNHRIGVAAAASIIRWRICDSTGGARRASVTGAANRSIRGCARCCMRLAAAS